MYGFLWPIIPFTFAIVVAIFSIRTVISFILSFTGRIENSWGSFYSEKTSRFGSKLHLHDRKGKEMWIRD